MLLVVISNAEGEPRPKAEARHERKLEGVGSTRWLGEQGHQSPRPQKHGPLPGHFPLPAATVASAVNQVAQLPVRLGCIDSPGRGGLDTRHSPAQTPPQSLRAEDVS
jgi:hypothetical protein